MAEEQQPAAVKNTVTIEQAGPCKKKVSVEIPPETIKSAVDEQYETLRKEALVPGFRKGRAPRRLLEKRFGKDTAEQVKLKLLADAGDSAIKDNKLNVLREPDIDFEKVKLPETGPLKFDFEVEVHPEFELPSLEAVAVEKTTYEVTAEQLDQELDHLRRWSGMWVPRQTGAVEPQDRLIADVVLNIEGVEEQEKLDNIEIDVRPNGFVGAIPVAELDEVLAGAEAAQTVETSVDVPKTYFRQEYRGKKVDIKITIREIKSLQPAELNEAFFKRLGVDDEKELRDRLEDSLQSRLEQQSRNEMTGQIYRYLLDKTSFELPTDIVAEQSTTLLQRQYANLLRQGLSAEQLEEQMDKLRAASDQQAAEQLRIFFIMDKVAAKLEIDVSEEELNGHIARLAIQQGQRPERLREQMLHNGSLAQFRLQVREDKCIAKLLESAKVTEVAPKAEPKKSSAEKKPAKKDKPAAKRKTKQ
jgi:trigger factor